MFAVRPPRAVRPLRAVPLRAAGAATAVALVLVPWVYAIRELRHAETVDVVARPQAIVWGDRVFSDKAAFADWLRARGVSYNAWARRHPGGLRTIDPKAARRLHVARRHTAKTRSSPATKAAAGPKPARAQQEAAAAAAKAATPSSTAAATDARTTALVYSLLGLVLLMLTLAFLPHRLVAARPTLGTVQAYRLHLLVGASAISLGVLTSALLS